VRLHPWQICRKVLVATCDAEDKLSVACCVSWMADGVRV